MNFDEIIVKESPGLCRCCLSEGCYKDLGKEHSWMGETEVYADILLECFDISISQHNEGPNGANRLICEVCITRLRDACNFKKQVQESEKKFVDMVGRGEFKPKVHIIYQPPLKAEEVEAEEAPGDADVEYLDEDIDFGDVDESVSRAAPARKRGRPRKGEPKPPRKLAKLVKAEEKTKSSKQMPKEQDPNPSLAARLGTEVKTEPHYFYEVEVDCILPNRTEIVSDQKTNKARATTIDKTVKPLKGKSKLRLSDDESDNITDSNADSSQKDTNRLLNKQLKKDLHEVIKVIVEMSTIMPFKHRNGQFKCFYCGASFDTTSALKTHTKEEHENAKTQKCLKYFDADVKIKLDISELACRLCPIPIHSVDNFLDHATQIHGCNTNKMAAKWLFAFSLSDGDMTCIDCGAVFRFFETLLRHAHKLHNKSPAHLCEVCGDGFVSKASLTGHVKNVHKVTQSCRCPACPNFFDNEASLTAHVEKVHKNYIYRCPQCPEMFTSRYFRKKHVFEVHGKKKFECGMCEKSFISKSNLTRHVSQAHLNEKKAECEICGFRTFDNQHLKMHKEMHDDSFNYQCDYCQKRFRRRKSLIIHVRIHTNDRRFVCQECGKAFVQGTSLKCHLRVHHSVH